MAVKDIAETVIAVSQEKAKATVQNLLLLGFLGGAISGSELYFRLWQFKGLRIIWVRDLPG